MNYEQWSETHQHDSIAREAYARYLESQKWDYFITVTFRRWYTDAIKAHEVVWANIHPQCSSAFLAVERHRYPNHNCHVHGLVRAAPAPTESGYVPGGTITELWRGLYERFGRSRVEEVRDSGQVSAYCSKYVTKKLSEYGFYGKPMFWT